MYEITPLGGAQSHSRAFGGVFPNITEAILVDEISTKALLPRGSLFRDPGPHGDLFQFL